MSRRGLQSPDPFDDALPGEERRRRASCLADARLLLVEGDAAARRNTREVLMALGLHRVIEAEDGLAALTMLQNRHLDVILAAQDSPGLSGLSLTRALRNDSRLSTVPVLLMVSSASAVLVRQAAELGVNSVLVWPYKPSVLEQKLSEALGLPPQTEGTS
ncbi:response regulator [Spongiibacter nanhainus]|uniref:Response regulator n=1 Tax=Spongiibacter nanhainus TaxID=2794344 RepID=A0A7T4UNP7_9GAMM|nr:response regulator [Spongiibacter nanhainus]QQD16791.1 response regulator [Spongiibacter nanhainus]